MDAERARKEAEVEETGKSEEVGREGISGPPVFISL